MDFLFAIYSSLVVVMCFSCIISTTSAICKGALQIAGISAQRRVFLYYPGLKDKGWILIDIHNSMGVGQAEKHSQPTILYDMMHIILNQ